MMRDIFPKTVMECAEALLKKEITSEEITEHYTDKICGHENSGVFITECSEKALKAARTFDSCENEKLITGIPYAVKDNIAVSGVRMTCASKLLENYVPSYTATVCEKAGGIILGKTNMDEFAMGSSSERSAYGIVRNPLNATRSCGGSSGGSAAAVASGLAPWALGTDTGGSARQPAAFCGIVAMKPTYGLVSRFGMTELASSLDTVCPMTSNVRDNAMVLTEISGYDPKDMTSVRRKQEKYDSGIDGGISGMHVGVISDYGKSCDEDAKKIFLRAGEILGRAGAEISEIDIERELCSLEIAIASYYIINTSESASNMARFDGIRYGMRNEGNSFEDIISSTRSDYLGEEVKRRIVSGTYLLSTVDGRNYYDRANHERHLLCMKYEELMKKYDCILMLTSETKAPELGNRCSDPKAMYMMDRLTCLANLTGAPALTVPIGGSGGLPYGATLMAEKFSEKKLYRAALVLENELRDEMRQEVYGYAGEEK